MNSTPTKEKGLGVGPQAPNESVLYENILHGIVGTVTVLDVQNPPNPGKTYRLANGVLEKTTAGTVIAANYRVVPFADVHSLSGLVTGLIAGQVLMASVPTNGTTSGRIVSKALKPVTPGAIARSIQDMGFGPGAGVLTLDYDPADFVAKNRAELWNLLLSIAPSLDSAGVLWWCSSSSYIYNGDQEINGLRGQRIYICLADMTDLARVGEIFTKRCWLLGQGRMDISKDGRLLSRTAFDAALWVSTQPDYISGAHCIAPVEQRRPAPVVLASGGFWDSRRHLPPLSPDEEAQVEALQAMAKAARQAEADAVRVLWDMGRESKQVTRLVGAGVGAVEALDRARSETAAMRRGVLTADSVLETEDGQIVTVSEMLDDPETWDRRIFKDPINPEHRGGSGCAQVYLLEPDGTPARVPNVHSFAGGEQDFRIEVVAQPKPNRFRITSAGKFSDQPPLRWLVKGLIPTRGVVAIYGPSGCGKSFLALDMLGAVGRGADWFCRRTTITQVLYICLEGAGGFGKRLKAYQQEVGELNMQVVAEQFKLNDKQDEVDMIALIQANGLSCGVVCIDTLAQATPGLDENSGADMTATIAACQRIQAATDSLIMLVHHTGKDSTKGLRGHSSLIGALDASIEVSGGAGVSRSWVARKVKDDAAGDPHSFELRSVYLGEDFDCDAITSCVIVPDLTPAARKPKKPGGGNQRLIWDALQPLFASATDTGQGGAPTGVCCLSLEAAVEQTRGHLTCATDQRSRSTRTAITGLVSSGLLGLKDGWLWLVGL